MSLLRDNDFTAKAVGDMIAEVEGRKPRKKKAPPRPTIVYNTVYNSGAASSATTSSKAPVHREISTPPTPRVSPMTRRWRRPEHPSVGTDQSATGKCSDDGIGFVKNLSGRLARKLQRSRWSMRVFQNKCNLYWTRQSLIDVTLSKSAALMLLVSQKPCNNLGSLGLPCCTHTASETTTHRHVRSSLAGLSEKRRRKAWFSPPVTAHQNNSTRCSLRARQFFRKFIEYAAAALQFGGHICWLFLAKCAGWSSVELRDCRAQQKSCGRELLMTACDSCCFAKRETICWNIIVGNSSHPILVSKST